MWRKNLLFSIILLLGAASVLAGLRQARRLEAMVENPIPGAPADADFQRTVEQIDGQFREYWAEHQLPTSAPADPLIVARRLSLALTGTIPSLEEIRAFESLPSEQRMDWWMEHLLSDRRHADYLAERFARAFVGTDEGPFLVFRRRRFVNWLSDQWMDRKPYDLLVRELLAGRGTWTNNPAVNFVTATVDDGTADPIRLAGRTSRAFLGMRIDCLQCHDDFLGNSLLGDARNPRAGTQRDFHQLAAYFAEVRLSPLGVTDQRGEAYRYQYLDADEDEDVAPRPPFSLGVYSSAASDGDVVDDLLNDVVSDVVNDMVDDASSPSAASTPRPRRRQQLAHWVTHPDNRPFARAAVNRVWALLFGRPLVEPIDDIPLLGPFPPGLELLADDFVHHGFDLQRLIRLIAATEVFHLDSRADFEVSEQHEQHWSVFPLTRLRPEQVAGALLQACSVKTIDSRSHLLTRIVRFAEGNEFVTRFGDIGEDEFSDRGGTIPQRLLMMNGKVIHERTRGELLANAATQISNFASTNQQAIEAAYLAVYSRRPDPEELEHFQRRLHDQRGKRHRAVIEDLYWALLNSTEFSWNH